MAAQGESLRIAADLANILDWDIDFHTDLRQGDTFRLLIEEHRQRGKRPTYQRILAAELINQGQTYQAVYYAPKGARGGFYRPDGRAMQRMFLSSPLPYARISSHFSHTRLHPILKVVRPHLGVDYAAPRGTPVRSVGDGVIEWAGAKGGNGKMIVIRHNTIYMTYYLHLDRFARGLSRGKRVAQGQIIGYVGSTGLSTGPHLDFRLSEQGKFLNPVTHKSFETPPMPQEVLAVYRLYAQRLLARLEQPAASPTRWVATVR
jgi:murein DD-endopeptidase MepM/ murein hydrolase activator NlpD